MAIDVTWSGYFWLLFGNSTSKSADWEIGVFCAVSKNKSANLH